MTKEKKRFMEMCSVAYDVQTTTDRVVFLTFSGHVNSFDLSVAISKERYHERLMDRDFIYLDVNYDKKIEELRGFLGGGKIAYVEANDLGIKDIGKTFFIKEGENSFSKIVLHGITANGYTSGDRDLPQLYKEMAY